MIDISLSDLLALGALVFSVYVGIRQIRYERLAPMKSDVLQAIRDLKDLTEGVSEQVIDHITYAKTRLDKEYIYRFQRKADAERSGLEVRLECRKEEIFRKYTEWWNAVSASFPIEVKTNKVSPQSTEVQGVLRAQNDFNKFLTELMLACHRGQLKIK